MVYPYLTFAQQMAQRLGSTPAGQRITDYAQRGMEAAGRLENKWPSMARGPMGQFPARDAVDKIPLAPFSRGAAGAVGAGSVAAGGVGSFGGISNPFSSGPQSTVPQSMWDELTARGGGVPQNSPTPMAPANPTGGATLMDTIMADRQPAQSGSFGLQGFTMPPVQYGSADSMASGEPGYSGAAGALVPRAPGYSGGAAAVSPPMPPSRPKDLPGRTPGFLDQLLSGPSYQSNNMPVNVQAAGPAMQALVTS